MKLEVPEEEKRIQVVFISGFLTPHNWISYPGESIPSNISMIPVFPSPVASIHDRACQVFYELMGGVVDYGEEHAAFHDHDRYGIKFDGKLKSWSEKCPIIVVGHSLGGNTALALQHYLQEKRFPYFPNTSSEWIAGIVTVNSPLNGTIATYIRGLHINLPPIVKWYSEGCIVGVIVHILSYFEVKNLKLNIEHWKLGYGYNGSLLRLLKALFGVCVHSTTDNIAYDASVQSQLAWNMVHKAHKSTYYLSLVGKLDEKSSTSGIAAVFRSLVAVLLRDNGLKCDKISGIDVSHWISTGGDGLLSVHTQEYPRLMGALGFECPSSDRYDHLPPSIDPGRWHYIHRNHSHIAPTFACVDTWKVIWDGCALIDASYSAAKLVDKPVYVPLDISTVVDDDNTPHASEENEDHMNTKEIREKRSLQHEAFLRSSGDRPDMQSVYMSVDKRIFHYHLGIAEPLKLSVGRFCCLPFSIALIYLGWKKADLLIYAGVTTLAMAVLNSATLLPPREGKKSSFTWSSDGLQTYFVGIQLVCLLYGNVQCQPMLLFLESLWEILCPHLCYSTYSTWWFRLGIGAVTNLYLAYSPSPAVLQFFVLFFAHFAVVSLFPVGGWIILALLEKNPEYTTYRTLNVLSNIIFVVMMISFITSLAIILAPLIMFSQGGIEWKALCGLVPVNIYAYFKVHQDISEVLQYISILAYYAADKKCK